MSVNDSIMFSVIERKSYKFFDLQKDLLFNTKKTFLRLIKWLLIISVVFHKRFLVSSNMPIMNWENGILLFIFLLTALQKLFFLCDKMYWFCHVLLVMDIKIHNFFKEGLVAQLWEVWSAQPLQLPVPSGSALAAASHRLKDTSFPGQPTSGPEPGKGVKISQPWRTLLAP